jgi:hypothetical protein
MLRSTLVVEIQQSTLAFTKLELWEDFAALSAVCTTRYPYLLEWRSTASLITLEMKGLAENRSSSSRMSKTAAKSKFGIERDKEFLLNAPEVCLFVACLGLVKELRGLEAAFKRSESTRGVFQDKASAMLAHLNETVDATERFDIVMPVMGYGQFSPFFWRWFNWWDDYFKGLTLTQIGDIARQARERVPTVNDYRPENHWATYRHTPAFTLVPS